ncbi:MAG: hypothetical protein AAF943_15810, partial [Pseudomonadota bacterium]
GVGALAKRQADKSVERGSQEIQDYLAGLVRKTGIRSTGASAAVGSAPVSERLQTGLRSMLSQRQETRQ